MRVLVTSTEAYSGCPVAPMPFEDSRDIVGHGRPWRSWVDAVDIGQVDHETFNGGGHTRFEQFECLLKAGQVDERLFWKAR